MDLAFISNQFKTLHLFLNRTERKIRGKKEEENVSSQPKNEIL
jgi:hypothetical protein